ncbi:MAG: S8 family peptidase [Acetobacter sp.]|jgi:hypothetical protein|nr:S8 family peptidase [Acetobacter sp.]MCH4060637.1 S8 family peptidase [Acetobacter sp.]MCH4087577.1 S8 family peptidase [Acetobacter sp.]
MTENTNKILPLRRIADPQKRIKGRPDKRRRPKIAASVQIDRLDGIMQQTFENILERDDIDVAADPSALAPERALVLEIIGNPTDFAKAAEKAGLEWLAEEVVTLHGVHEYFDPDNESKAENDQSIDNDVNNVKDSDEVNGRFYLGMPTKASFERLRKLWDAYVAGKKAPYGEGAWWSIFSYLHKIRPWGAEDRISNAVRDRLFIERQFMSGDDVNLEIDLWYRGDAIQRENADLAFRSVLAEIDGVVLDELRIEEIRYHSVLVKIPVSQLDAIIDLTGPMVIADEIMSIRPQGIFKFNVDEPDIEVCRTETNIIEDPGRKSIGALIDGWPVENHTLLRNRLDVIPLDVGASLAPTQTRYHGTAMASLILRGDAHSESSPISRRLKVVPVLAADSAGYESTPSNKLPLGLIHHAVKELKEGLNGQPPSGSDVVIINHSICDEAFGFSGTVSPWARLLDYLSWKYKILFVVSAGNICEYFDVPEYQNAIELRAAAPDARKEVMLCALAAAKSKRTMFAPAESVNALTVAAAHSDDSSEQLPPNLADPFISFPTANLCSGLGLGFNQSIKPDVMFPGGRQIAHPTTMNGLMVQGREAPNFFGQKVASPDPYSGDLNMVRRSSGTSNAAALTTRAGLLIADVLDESPLSGSDGLTWDARSTAPCVLKALIAHGATWGSVGETMASVYGASLSKNRAKEMVSRVIGYGCVDPGRIISENSRRVTLLGQDIIKKDQRHQWRIPLPYELSSVAEFR